MVMCPLTVELRQGWNGVWQVRADYTHDAWQDTTISNIRPEEDARRVVKLDCPDYKVVLVTEVTFDA